VLADNADDYHYCDNFDADYSSYYHDYRDNSVEEADVVLMSNCKNENDMMEQIVAAAVMVVVPPSLMIKMILKL